MPPAMPTLPGRVIAPVQRDMPSGPAPVLNSIGHPTFDPTPGDIQARRAKTDATRARLSALAQTIRSETSALKPMIEELAPDARLLLKSDNFDVTAAQTFVEAAAQLVTALAADKGTDRGTSVPPVISPSP